MKCIASLISCLLAGFSHQAYAAATVAHSDKERPARHQVARATVRIVDHAKIENGRAVTAGLPVRQTKRKVRCATETGDDSKDAICNEVLLEIE